MNPSVTAEQPTEAKRLVRGGSVFDTVRVSPDTFQSVMFMSSTPRTEWSETRQQGEEKRQKFTRDGMPVWSVKVAATNWRDQDNMLSVTIASQHNPGEVFTRGQLVQFGGLTFGVSPKRDGGFVTWCSADSVEAVGSATKLKAAAEA